jgi:hypothetical protein
MNLHKCLQLIRFHYDLLPNLIFRMDTNAEQFIIFAVRMKSSCSFFLGSFLITFTYVKFDK